MEATQRADFACCRQFVSSPADALAGRLEGPRTRCSVSHREGACMVLSIERGQVLGVMDAGRTGTLTAHRLLEWLAAPGSRMLVSGRQIEPNAPDVLVCDDPTAGRDRSTADEALRGLQQANRQPGLTVVMVTDSPEVIRRVCDAVAVVQRGRMIEQLHLGDLLAVPRSEAGRAVLRGARSRWPSATPPVHARASRCEAASSLS